jgi:hypothetical protein
MSTQQITPEPKMRELTYETCQAIANFNYYHIERVNDAGEAKILLSSDYARNDFQKLFESLSELYIWLTTDFEF